MKTTLLFNSVIFITLSFSCISESRRQKVQQSFVFHPTTSQWKNEQITKLQIPSQLLAASDNPSAALPLTEPSAIVPITGDGNCLFRALSYTLTGTERHYHHVRLAICNFMETNPNDVLTVLPDTATDVQSYLIANKMNSNGTWGTEAEVIAASVLLQTNLYVYSKHGVHWQWIKHSPSNLTVDHGIYLYHKNLNHFEVVIAVENSNVPSNFSPNQYYCPKTKYQTDVKNRKREIEKERYRYDETFNKRKKQAQKEIYNTNTDGRAKKLHLQKEKYNQDENVRTKKLKSIRNRYHENKSLRHKKQQMEKDKYNSDKAFRSGKLQAQRLKYASDPLFADKKKQSTKKLYYSNICYRKKKHLASVSKYCSNSSFRCNLRHFLKRKYSENQVFRQNVGEYSKKKYSENSVYRQNIREYSKNKYADNPVHRQNVKEFTKRKYADNLVHRENVREYSKKKYAENTVHRENVREYSKKTYAENTVHRKNVREYSKKKYAENTVHRKNVREYSKKKYAENTVHRKNVREYSKKKYAENTVHRENVREYSKKTYAENTVHRENVREYSKKKYAENTVHRENVREYSKKKYAENTVHRENVREYSKKKYAENTVHRQKVKQYSISKYQRFSTFRKKVTAASIKKYATNPLFRISLKCYLRKKYQQSVFLQQRKKKQVAVSRQVHVNSVKAFKRCINDSPKYICKVCIRLLYRTQVKICKEERYFEKDSDKLNEIAEKCFTATSSHICDDNECPQNCYMKILNEDKNWICHTCDRHLIQKSMPPQAQANNLFLSPVPTELSKLNILERQLIALRIPFMKLLSLPRGGQKGVKGPVVNVPSDITSVTTSLPRNLNEAQLVKVKLKRKLSYKGHYTYKWISPSNVIAALQKLKCSNIWYENIDIDEAWLENIADSDLVKQTSDDSCINSDDEPTESRDNVKSTDTSNNAEQIATQDMNFNLPVETCFQPIDMGQDVLDSNKTLCIAPSEGQKPQNIFQENGSDAMAFPTLLPNGRFGLFDDREVKLTPSKYFNARLFSADSRFATNNEFIFFAQYVLELNSISSNISLALRKGNETTTDGKQVTASMLLDSDNIGNILKSDIGYRFLQPVRGTPPYWQRTIKELYAMIQQLGIPTWFVTFSAAEMRWDDVIRTLLFLSNDNRTVEDIGWSERCTLITNNPVICARMFDNRVKALFRELIMSPSAPVGTVTDYFYRTEFQQRGSPHIHCLFWVKNAPKFDENSDEEICSFIDKYVTCEMPDQTTDPELYDIISSVQVHSKTHSKSCKKYSTSCRFNFPRPPICKTFIARADPVEKEKNKTAKEPTIKGLDEMSKFSGRTPKQILNDILTLISAAEQNNSFFDILKLSNITYKQFKQCLIDVAKTNTVYLKRRLSDIWVNNYNPHLSRAWNANLDIQYVTDAYACVAYILSYISKSETEMGDLLQNAQQEAEEGNIDAASAMRKIGNVYLQNREVSAQEAVYRVTGLHLKQCTRDVVFIPAGSNIVKMSLPVSVIKSRCSQGGADNKNIWMTSIHEKYYARPDHKNFDDMCLAEFCSKFRFLPKSQNPKSTVKFPVYHLKNDLGSIRKRKPGNAAVIRYPRFNSEKKSEEYHLTLAQLYLPHRSPITLPPDIDSFENYIKSASINGQRVLHVINRNKRNFEIDSELLEQAWQDLQEGRVQDQSWGSLAPETEVERLEIEMEKEIDTINEHDQEEIPELIFDNTSNSEKHSFQYEPPTISHKAIQESLRNMNTTQQKIFFAVKQWCLHLLWNKKPEPFFIFLTGGAGTGKSHVIRCIYHEASRILSKYTSSPESVSILLTAPTGTAAFNIQGMTIHSAFAINKNVKLPYQPLGENLLNTLRSKFESLQILVIDEISMVDQKILTYIHGRLSQIKHTKKSFGNVSILAVGDFYQLPPVRGLALYKKRESSFVDLWNTNFSKVTLEEVMRQKDDCNFAQMLNRLRTHTRGIDLIDIDLKTLENISKIQLPDEKKHILHIYPTNREVNNHNNDMIVKCCNPVYSSLATDFSTDIVTGKLCKRDQPYDNCLAEDLQTEVKVGLGARVMLTRNIDTDDGLVNGAFGTVSGLDLDNARQIKTVKIKFDNKKVGHKTLRKQNAETCEAFQGGVGIKPFQDLLVGKKVTRKQFPLKLAYAATIHKVQGMTVDQIAVSLKNIFQPGMAYVALSRATSLSGLHILNFNPDSIYSSTDITKALEEMPNFLPQDQSSELHQSEINIIHHNTEGLLPHLLDIKSVPRFRSADIICFTETWLNNENTIPSSLLPGYQVVQLFRADAYSSNQPVVSKFSTMNKGGVAVFVKQELDHERFSFKSQNVEAVCIIVKNICIVAVYRPPSYPYELFVSSFTNILMELQHRQLPTVIVGDFNVNIMLPSNKNFEQKMKEYGYIQMINVPTTESGTCLDLVFLKGLSDRCTVEVLPTHYSFHEALIVSIKKPHGTI